MGNWNGENALEIYLRSYFLCCPICGNTQLTVNLVSMGRDTLMCNSCKAVWHVHIGLTGLKWAELDLNSQDGRGREFFGKRFNSEEIRRLAQKTRLSC